MKQRYQKLCSATLIRLMRPVVYFSHQAFWNFDILTEEIVNTNFRLPEVSAWKEKKSEVFFNVFTGLGPGGLIIPSFNGPLPNQCIAGSSHGGKGHQGSVCKAGPPYDIENMTSLLGGSGGECVYIIIFYNPATIFPLRSFATGKTPFQSSSDPSMKGN